jgi:hypothetical protein
MAQFITNEKVLEAAKEHAKNQLGMTQFANNQDAVKSVATDFIDGIKWLLTEIRKDEEVIDLVDQGLEYHD